MSVLNQQQRDEILDEIKAGRKIGAIKLYREATGDGLKEAKEFIEELTAQLLEDDPNSIPPSTSGCGTAVFALVVLVSVGWVCFNLS